MEGEQDVTTSLRRATDGEAADFNRRAAEGIRGG